MRRLLMLSVCMGLALSGCALSHARAPADATARPDSGVTRFDGGPACDQDDDGAPALSCRGDDCDDHAGDVLPGATERCDGVDQDCDGAIDEGVSSESFVDADGDGYGDPATALPTCGVPSGRVELGGDCNDADPTVFPGAGLTAPVLFGPDNGALTGSVHGASAGTLTPTFEWLPVAACDASYQLQVDDECGADRAACSFGTPEVDVVIASTRYRPSDALPVSVTAPVGRRYYWRVRACAATACGTWSAVRYLDVGRTNGDFDGDGYGDLAVGSALASVSVPYEGAVSIYRGGPAPDTTRTLQLDDPEDEAYGNFGEAIASAGDLNADGFADLAVGATSKDDRHGVVFVYLGSASGLSPTPNARLVDAEGVYGEAFGGALRAAGDVDADGYADLVVGAFSRIGWFEGVPGAMAVFRGGPAGISTTPTVRVSEGPWDAFFGWDVASGDLDRDGYSDVLVTGHGIDTLFVYFGMALGLTSTPDRTLMGRIADNFPTDAFVGEYTGDGLRDIATSTGPRIVLVEPFVPEARPIERFRRREDHSPVTLISYVLTEREGQTFVLAGSSYDEVFMYPVSEPWSDANRTVLSVDPDPTSGFMYPVVASIDLDGDGYADPIAALASRGDVPSLGLYAWRGTATGSSGERFWRVFPPAELDGMFGATLMR